MAILPVIVHDKILLRASRQLGTLTWRVQDRVGWSIALMDNDTSIDVSKLQLLRRYWQIVGDKAAEPRLPLANKANAHALALVCHG